MKRILDGNSHSVFWGIVEFVYIATAIFVGVEFGWKAGVICFLAPICVYFGGFLISATFWLAVNLFVYGVVEGVTRTGGWLHQTLRNTKERRKRRKQAQVICRRCGLRTDALTAEEALALSEDDIHAVAWATREAGRGSAENLAHILADPESRELLSDGLPRLYLETAKAEAKLRAQVTLVTKRAMVAKAVKILLQK